MILLIDFGSQTAHLIARRVRDLGGEVAIVPPEQAYECARADNPRGIILSGGPASVYGKAAPTVNKKLFDLGIPILGICYGLQLIAHLLGGTVKPGKKKEFGPATLSITAPSLLFSHVFPSLSSHRQSLTNSRHGVNLSKSPSSTSPCLRVWMSHGDTVIRLPRGFTSVGKTETIKHAAVADEARRIWGIQFHPEVVHTDRGTEILTAFLTTICGVTLAPRGDIWRFINDAIANIRKTVKHERAICALSGGVDSTVAAILAHRAIGSKLTAVYVDSGLMRMGETKQVRQVLDGLGMRMRVARASGVFLRRLKGIVNPEQKRKIIGKTFIEVFEKEALRLARGNRKHARFLVQGTIYPDVIESRGTCHADRIKSHHNVACLPRTMRFALIEPLRQLYKDEVRRVGRALGLPEEIINRQPFPGPGLAIRIIGEITKKKLAILRRADAIVEEELAEQRQALWQAFAILTGVKTTGVRGDQRAFGETIAIRAVEATDAMSARWSRLPYEVLERISVRIVNEVKGINRVVYDITNKPPATMEWE